MKESEAQTVHGTGLEDQKINEGKLGGWREKKKRKIKGDGGFKSPRHQCVKPTSPTRWLEDIPFLHGGVQIGNGYWMLGAEETGSTSYPCFWPDQTLHENYHWRGGKQGWI